MIYIEIALISYPSFSANSMCVFLNFYLAIFCDLLRTILLSGLDLLRRPLKSHQIKTEKKDQDKGAAQGS